MPERAIKTPCIGVCSTGIGDSVCRGCKRFSHEVIDWNGYTSAQKLAVDTRLSGFLSQCVSNKVRVVDVDLLRWQLEVQQVRFVAHHDEYCWVFSLLKAGAGQIQNTRDFGFEVDLRHQALPLPQLREQIDLEYYILSEAYYERYFLSPDLFRERRVMNVAHELAAIQSFLLCPTPTAWVEWALENPELLLIDHANCEKKAASTALNLMYRYVEHHKLLLKLSRLAREELRHFEQVLAIMKARGVTYPQLPASRYAGLLHKQVRTHEPGRLVDTLLIGAIIEARSCERFARLAPVLDAKLGEFYSSLLKSEARHFNDYLKLAEEVGAKADIAARLPVLLACEKDLIESVDVEFRFHSGVPAVAS